MSEETTQKTRKSDGNASAMREVLQLIEREISTWENSVIGISRTERMFRDAARAALATPPRNCDVGTPEEQAKRHTAYCSISRSCFYSGCIRICFAEWSQMPYTEGSAK